MKNLITALGLCALAQFSFAQDLLITNASVMDGDKTVKVDILIEDGKIEKISADLRGHGKTPHYDAAGKLVTPALFAGVTVSGLSEVEMVYEAVDSRIKELYTEVMHPEFDVRVAYNPHSSVIPITRIEGFGYALLAATSGDRSILGSGGLVRFDGGYESFEGDKVVYIDIDGHSADNVGGSRAAHWMLLKQSFDEVKLSDNDELELLSPEGKRTLRDVIKSGVFVFNANRASDIVQTLKFAKAHQLKIAIHGGREAWIVADKIAEAKVPVILNALDNLPMDFDSLGSRLDNAALLNKAGVEVMFSSGETHNARKVRQVAGTAVSYGLPHNVAMNAMTTGPAHFFGGTKRSLDRGAVGDLVIWSGDPLEVNTYAEQVVIGGKLDSMQSRQTKLRDRYFKPDPELGPAYAKP